MYKDRTGIHAVVKTACSDEFAVNVGNYLGLNDGRVMKISEDRITIVEVVPDGKDGWQELERHIPVIKVKP
jgi:type IV pilus assembly protein PilP